MVYASEHAHLSLTATAAAEGVLTPSSEFDREIQ